MKTYLHRINGQLTQFLERKEGSPSLHWTGQNVTELNTGGQRCQGLQFLPGHGLDLLCERRERHFPSAGVGAPTYAGWAPTATPGVHQAPQLAWPEPWPHSSKHHPSHHGSQNSCPSGSGSNESPKWVLPGPASKSEGPKLAPNCQNDPGPPARDPRGDALPAGGGPGDRQDRDGDPLPETCSSSSY